jgi:hypothetical protein
VSEEKITEHFKECRLAIDNACAALASAQIKTERKLSFVETGEEFEQTELVFKKNTQSFKVAGEAKGMSKTTPFLFFWIMAWNLSPLISCFLTLTRSLMQHLRSEYSLRRCCKLTY